jgi:prepilin-type N-terminal cleavage/methylation domain-containing protein
MKKSRKGFTLVEVLIVVTLIGILASLTLPRFIGQQERGRVAEAIGILSAIKRGQEVYFNENGRYLDISSSCCPVQTNADPALWGQIGMQPPQSRFWAFATTNRRGGFAIATRNTTSTSASCDPQNPRGTIFLSLNPATGLTPWQNFSNGCYAVGQPFHPAS